MMIKFLTFLLIVAVCASSWSQALIHSQKLSTVQDKSAGMKLNMAPQTTLYDTPVSNNGARVRMIIKCKDLEKKAGIVITSPASLGGLKSESYLALNPQGKMPLLVTETFFPIPESDTICRYLINRYRNIPPSFEPSCTEQQCLSDLICRLHDVYITPV